MGFKIDESTVIYPRTNVYKITLGFMLGDGDNFDTVDIFMSKDEFESKTKELLRFTQTILKCIEHDNRGRCGIQNSDDLYDEYIKIKDWAFFCDNVFDADKEPDDCLGHSEFITYDIPSDSDGWYYSHVYVEISYYDEKGLMYNVLIEE